MGSCLRAKIYGLRFRSSRKISARRKQRRESSLASLSEIRATPSSLTSAKKIFQAFLVTASGSSFCRGGIGLGVCVRGSGFCATVTGSGLVISTTVSSLLSGSLEEDFPFPLRLRLERFLEGFCES